MQKVCRYKLVIFCYKEIENLMLCKSIGQLEAIFKQVQFQKHLCVYLDDRLDFPERFCNIFKMVNRRISLLRKLQNILPRAPLVTLYKSFIRPHLDYGDILYDQILIILFMKSSNRFNIIQHLQ